MSKSNGQLQIHPYAMLLPPMQDAEFQSLKADIAAHGQRDPARVFKGEILDGRNRERACRELGIQLKTEDFKGTEREAIGYVYSQAVRRNMNDSQKACAAVHFLPHFENFARKAGDLQRGGTSSTSANGKSRDLAGGLFGVSGRYIQDARLIFETDKKLFHEVFEGRLPITRAKRQLHNNGKAKATAEKAHRSWGGDTRPHFLLEVGDCLARMEANRRAWCELIIADPPYNIGVNYGGGKKQDELPRRKYLDWCFAWMKECAEQLTPDGSFWIIINDENAAELALIGKGLKLHLRRWVKWYETFGVNCSNNFNRTSRHLLYFVRDPQKFVFNADAVKRKSDRQEIHGDKRANPDGKIWDDVWKIPRLVDNAAERVPGFPTQLPLALIKPIVACCSDAGDNVMDPFTGSGTSGEAAILLHRRFVGYEKNPAYAKLAEQRLRIALAERK